MKPQLTAEERRMHTTFDAVALPLIQSSTISVVCILYLPLASAYVPDVFAKSVVLVNVIGLTHTSVLLPVLMILLHARIPTPLARLFKQNAHA